MSDLTTTQKSPSSEFISPWAELFQQQNFRSFLIDPSADLIYVSGASLSTPTIPETWVSQPTYSIVPDVNSNCLGFRVEWHDLLPHEGYISAQNSLVRSTIIPFNVSREETFEEKQNPLVRILTPKEAYNLALEGKKKFEEKWKTHFENEVMQFSLSNE